MKNDFWKNINNYKIPHPFLKKEAKSANENVIFDMMTADEFFNQIMIDDTVDNKSSEYLHTKEEIKETISVVLNPPDIEQDEESVSVDISDLYNKIVHENYKDSYRGRELRGGIDENDSYQRIRQIQDMIPSSRRSRLLEDDERYQRIRQMQEDSISRRRIDRKIDEDDERYERMRQINEFLSSSRREQDQRYQWTSNTDRDFIDNDELARMDEDRISLLRRRYTNDSSSSETDNGSIIRRRRIIKDD